MKACEDAKDRSKHVKSAAAFCHGVLRSVETLEELLLNCTQYTKKPFCPSCSPVSCSEETDAATNKTNGTFLQTLLESMSFSSLRPRECTEVRRTPRGAFLPSHFSTANTQEKQRNSNLTSQHRQHDMAAPLCLPHVDANCAFGSVSCRQRVMWQKIRLLTDEDRRF